MCCYKLVECEFKWFGLQGTVESRIQKVRGREGEEMEGGREGERERGREGERERENIHVWS